MRKKFLFFFVLICLTVLSLPIAHAETSPDIEPTWEWFVPADIKIIDGQIVSGDIGITPIDSNNIIKISNDSQITISISSQNNFKLKHNTSVLPYTISKDDTVICQNDRVFLYNYYTSKDYPQGKTETLKFSTSDFSNATLLGTHTDTITYEMSFGEISAIFRDGNGTMVPLTWDDLMKPEYGTKFNYNANLITSGAIMNNAFADCSSLVSINIPNEVTSIGENAFSNCSSLNEIAIPSNIINIGNFAFNNCSSLTAINVDENNSNYSSVDGVLHDKNKTKLIQYPMAKPDSSYTILPTVSVIGVDSFKGCIYLNALTIHKNITTLNNGLPFVDCQNLEEIFCCDQTKAAVVGKFSQFAGPETCKIHCFDDCFLATDFTSVPCALHPKVPGYATFIKCLTNPGCHTDITKHNDSCWTACNDTLSWDELQLQENAAKYGYSASKIQNNKIFNYAFRNTGLSVIQIPDGITNLDGFAFAKCLSLTELYISKTVNSIGEYLVSENPTLKHIVVDNRNPYYCSVDDVLFNADMTLLVIYPSKKTDVTYRIPDTVTTIDGGAFSRRTYLQFLTIPKTVTTFEAYSFDIPLGDSLDQGDFIYEGTLNEWKAISKGEKWDDKCNRYKIHCLDACVDSTLTVIECPYHIRGNIFNNDAAQSYSWENLQAKSIGDIYGYNSSAITNDSIGDNAFNGCTQITQLNIPVSVITIGSSAIANCTNLTNINYNGTKDEWRAISKAADWYDETDNYIIHCSDGCVDKEDTEGFECPLHGQVVATFKNSDGTFTSLNLKELQNPENGEKYGYDAAVITTVSFDYHTFYNCTTLVEIRIPDNIKSLSEGVFDGCSNLTTVTMGNAITKIPTDAFKKCAKLTSIKLSDNITEIGNNAFYQCSNLQSIDIPDGVTLIGTSAFESCSKLPNIHWPQNLQTISEKAFRLCSSITEISLPDSVVTIGKEAFSSCYGLQSITLPNNLSTIGVSAFNSCRNLSTIEIPSTVQTIGEHAFRYCASLESINVDENNANYSSESGVLFDKNKTKLIKYPPKKIDANYEIPNEVKTIFNIAFEGSAVESVVGNNVTTIKNSAFQKSGNLKSINFPAVTTIRDNAFDGCVNLDNVVLPEGLTKIESSTFRQCKNLSSITLPSSLTEIGKWAFQHCTSLSTIVMPQNLKTIGPGAFEHCTSLANFVIPESVTTLKDYVVAVDPTKETSVLKTITIPVNVTNFETHLIAYCTALTDIYYTGTMEQWNTITKDSEWNIGANEYIIHCTDGCLDKAGVETTCAEHGISTTSDITVATFVVDGSNISLTWDELKDTEKANQYGYKADSISDSNIGDCAFQSCVSLQSIRIPDGVANIGQSAFESSGLTNIQIPTSVLSIGNGAFDNCSNLTDIYYDGSEEQWQNVVPLGSEIESELSSCTIHYAISNLGLRDPEDNLEDIDESMDEIQKPSFINEELTIAIFQSPVDSSRAALNLNDLQKDENKELYGYQENIFDGTRINDAAFGLSNTLCKFIVPSEVTSIGECAFYGCSLLSDINIPISVTSIEPDAFANSQSLTVINYAGTMEQWNSIFKGEDWNYNISPICTIYCNDGYLDQFGNVINSPLSTIISEDEEIKFDENQNLEEIEDNEQKIDVPLPEDENRDNETEDTSSENALLDEENVESNENVIVDDEITQDNDLEEDETQTNTPATDEGTVNPNNTDSTIENDSQDQTNVEDITDAVTENPEEQADEIVEVSPTPVIVIFSCTPANPTIIIYPSDKNENYAIDAENDGTYKLYPGEYTCVIIADGYEKAFCDLTITEDMNTPVIKEITLVLIPEPEEEEIIQQPPTEEVVYDSPTVDNTQDNNLSVTEEPVEKVEQEESSDSYDEPSTDTGIDDVTTEEAGIEPNDISVPPIDDNEVPIENEI